MTAYVVISESLFDFHLAETCFNYRQESTQMLLDGSMICKTSWSLTELMDPDFVQKLI